MTEPSRPSTLHEIFKETLISISIILVTSFFTRNFLSEGYLVGWDSMTHVFKTWFTMECLSGRANFDWCEYWYTGSPIMPMYAPLFYIISGLLGRLSGLDALTASKWVVFASFPASSLSFYFSTRRRSSDPTSLAGAVLYGLIPWHLTYITILGNPTYALCYIFVPPLFKFLREKDPPSIIYASISFFLIMLSHQGTGFLFAYALVWYALFSGLLYYKFKEFLYPIIKIGLVSIGILSFFWIPYIYYSMKTSSFKIPFSPGHESLTQLFQKSHFMYLGLPLSALFLLSIFINAQSLNKGKILHLMMLGFSIILTFGYTYTFIKLLYPFSRLIGPGYRFNILSSFMISISITDAMREMPTRFFTVRLHGFSERNNHLRGGLFTLSMVVITLLASIITVFPISQFHNMPIPRSHYSIYSIIADQTLSGRIWWVPRGALQASIPMFTGRATPDGWYDQGADPEIYDLIHDLADVRLKNDPEYFVEKLKDLSVRFLIVPNGPISDSLKGLDRLVLLSEYQDLVLFQVENINPLEINQPPSFSRFIRIIGFLSSGIFTIYLLLSIRYQQHNKRDYDIS